MRLYFFIALVAAFAGILFGFDTGVISGAILFLRQEFHLSDQMNGIVVGMVLVGAFLGAVVSGHLSDQVGRKRLLIIDTIIFIIGTILTGYAHSIVTLLWGRFVVGVAIGVSSYSAPLYIAEVAPAKHRGALVSLNQLSIAIGLLLAYGVDYWFAGEQDWRMMFLTGLIPAVGLLCAMFLLPNSPRWVAMRGRLTEAMSILQLIRKDTDQARGELREIESTLSLQKASWHSLFEKKVIPVLVLGILLAVIQQVTGINTVLYYAPTIFADAGFVGPEGAILITVLIGLVFVAFSALALPMIDSYGRRFLLLVGVGVMAISLLVLGALFLPGIQRSHGVKLCIVAMMLVYIAAFAISLGPVMWLMIAEIFPIHVRGFGASICTAANWAANWLVAVTFLQLVDDLGRGWTFLIYAAASLLSLWFIWRYVPETKGVSLESIETKLLDGRDLRDIGGEVEDVFGN